MNRKKKYCHFVFHKQKTWYQVVAAGGGEGQGSRRYIFQPLEVTDSPTTDPTLSSRSQLDQELTVGSVVVV